MSATPARRFPWWVYWVLLGLIVVVALLPAVPVVIAGMIVDAHGCGLNEGSPTPCMVDGKDMGSTLYTMGMMAWFLLATIPLGFVAFLVWLAVLVIHRLAWNRRRASP